MMVSVTLTIVRTMDSRNVYCDSPFDNKGFPLVYTPDKFVSPSNPSSLYLSGVGMRRKSLFVVEVDVYLVGLAMTLEAQKSAKTGLTSGLKFSDILLAKNDFVKNNISVPKVSTTLKFVRNVTTTQVVEAFNDAFKGCNPSSVTNFKSVLKSCIGENGMKAGESITFFWLKDGGLVFEKDGELSTPIRDIELEGRLLDVYIDSGKTVSPELVASFESHLESIA